MNRYEITVEYRGRVGFAVRASSPEEAIKIVRDGDPGEALFDEPVGTDGYVIFNGDGDEIARADGMGEIEVTK